MTPGLLMDLLGCLTLPFFKAHTIQYLIIALSSIIVRDYDKASQTGPMSSLTYAIASNANVIPDELDYIREVIPAAPPTAYKPPDPLVSTQLTRSTSTITNIKSSFVTRLRSFCATKASRNDPPHTNETTWRSCLGSDHHPSPGYLFGSDVAGQTQLGLDVVPFNPSVVIPVEDYTNGLHWGTHDFDPSSSGSVSSLKPGGSTATNKVSAAADIGLLLDSIIGLES
ncbi:hypothetical protein QBC36DRAFT_314037 [Triangularia setosa]|uniref:Uncharacterized protein n=1 Tax=Triangularia setosa TaxID=2587417 RepID=A0AAN6W2W6_9PEZI|nr:hypothetical protein QBC36DRAFT_314037 [Podospora setosa]